MLGIFNMGGYEWLVILVIALLLFGRRLPEVMRSMGKGVKEFKRGLQDVQDSIDTAGEDDSETDTEKPPPPDPAEREQEPSPRDE
jgi:sec-independent protein translocase protein TatA